MGARLRSAALGALLLAVTVAVANVGAQAPAEITLRDPASPFVVFNVWIRSGSSADPKGKEGLASLTASLIASGSTTQDAAERIVEKQYPLAAGYAVSVDKEMTNVTGRVHRDNLTEYYALFRNAVLSPAFAEADFTRVKAQRLNYLERARRYARDEELSKQLLFWMAYEGTPFQHPEEGYVDSVRSITLDDVRGFYRAHYRRGNVTAGVGGGYPDGFPATVRRDLDTLPDGPVPAPSAVSARPATGLKVLLVEKETDASAISFGFPISVGRGHADFVPLLVANSYLGEHRNPVGRLYQRIREARGMNYGNYSYIEAFPAGYATQLPRVNVARRSQLFEVWIRPVVPENGPMALRIALHELRRLIADGLTQADFESTRDYLMKNVFVMTATQNQQLGYALDSEWYKIPEFTGYMREKLKALTLADVNAAVRKHLSGTDLSVVIVTKDAKALADALLADTPSAVRYDAPKPELADEDKAIGALKLAIQKDKLEITPIAEVFAK